MNINLNYSAPDLESLLAAIQAVRALGIAPIVATLPPTSRTLPPAPTQADGPNETT